MPTTLSVILTIFEKEEDWTLFSVDSQKQNVLSLVMITVFPQ